MGKRHIHSKLLRTLQAVDVKCDMILGILDVMRGEKQDSILESLRESARDIYQCSLEERRRTGRLFSVMRHD